jgi:hypothetical protein
VIPGQGIEPRSPRSERDVLPFRRSRIVVASLSRPNAQAPDDVFHAARLPFDPGSARACGSHATSYVEELWSRSSARSLEDRTLKHTRMVPAQAPRSFSLRRGLDSDLDFLQAEHHLCVDFGCSFLETTRATRLGRPSLRGAMHARKPRVRASQRGLRCYRAGARQRSLASMARQTRLTPSRRR